MKSDAYAVDVKAHVICIVVVVYYQEKITFLRCLLSRENLNSEFST